MAYFTHIVIINAIFTKRSSPSSASHAASTRSATKVVQASRWLGPQAARDAQVSRTLNRKLPDELKTLSYRHLVG